MSSKSHCEGACTSHEQCVGYQYDARDQVCYTFPTCSAQSCCPSRFTVKPKSIAAATSNDLEAYGSFGHVCYGKNLSNIQMPRFLNLILQLMF